MFDTPPQQLQSVGDLVGRAVRIYRQNVPLFFQALIWPTVILTVFKVVFQWGVTHGSTRVDMKDWTGVALAVGFGVIGFLGLIITSFFLQLRQMAFVRMANGFAQTYEQAYDYMRARKWKVLGFLLIVYVIAVAISFFWLIEISVSAAFVKSGQIGTAVAYTGMTVGMLGLFASLAFGALIVYTSYSVVSCEEKSIAAMLSRSFRLLTRDFWRALYFGSLLLAAVSLVSYPLSLPMVLLSVFEFVRQGMSADYLTDPSKMPFYWMVINQTWESLINIILWPVTFLAFGLFYYDLRMRQEALDLVTRVDELEKQSVKEETRS